MTTAVLERLASAPISWGVCEVPGWGIELPIDQVLSEMASLGFKATELGSDGYLPDDPSDLRRVVESHGLGMIGGFVPVVVHEPSQQNASLEAARRAAALMAGAGASVFISAAVTSWDWAPREPVDDRGWDFAATMFAKIDQIAADHGMVQALHPHYGTIVETRADVEQVLDVSDVGFTLDTGHLMMGGCDPLEFVEQHFDRIRHVHLKDVDMAVAQKVVSGELTLMAGVQSGMFCNLGIGDVPIDKIVLALEHRRYDGWYVVEQDAAITGTEEAAESPLADVAASVDHLRMLLEGSFS